MWEEVELIQAGGLQAIARRGQEATRAWILRLDRDGVSVEHAVR